MSPETSISALKLSLFKIDEADLYRGSFGFLELTL